MNRKPSHRHFPWTAAVVGFLTLIGAGLALAGALDWPLSRSLGLSTDSFAPDFLQAARQVIFNLWFVAVFVTAFALTQQRLKRRAARLACMPSPSQATARGQATASEGGMSRREFLIAGGSAVATTVALAGAGRLLFPEVDTVYAAEAITDTTVLASDTANTLSAATAVPVATAVPTATQAAQTVQTVVTTGRRLCNRGCGYPGHCGRYRDTNGNGTCDNTEAIW